MRIMLVTLLLMACGTQEKETQSAPAPVTADEAPAERQQMPELIRLDTESVWIAYDSVYWVYATPTVAANVPDSLFRYVVGVAMSPADNPPEDCENGLYSAVSARANSRIEIKGVEPGEYLLKACVIDMENGETSGALSKDLAFVK